MSANYVKAEHDYLRGMKYKDIAEKYNVSLNTVKSWKKRYGWSRDKGAPKVKGVHTNAKEVQPRRVGGQPGNKNALGNAGGPGGPFKNDKAVKHGLFRKFLPQDPEYMEIFNAAGETHPLDMLWSQIQIKFANIVHAQRVMFVRDQQDIVKHEKRRKESDTMLEVEWEFQYPWERQAAALNSQARAMGQLMTMIKQYEEMSRDWEDEERKLRLEKLKAEVDKAKAEAKEWADNGDDAHDLGKSYEDALNAQAGDVFADEVNDDAEA